VRVSEDILRLQAVYILRLGNYGRPVYIFDEDGTSTLFGKLARQCKTRETLCISGVERHRVFRPDAPASIADEVMRVPGPLAAAANASPIHSSSSPLASPSPTFNDLHSIYRHVDQPVVLVQFFIIQINTPVLKRTSYTR
jgi:hypothetical protein